MKREILPSPAPKEEFTITFSDGKGGALYETVTMTVEEGDAVVPPTWADKEDEDEGVTYSFKNWTPSVVTPAAGNANYVAEWDEI